MDRSRIALVIPALNEERSIGEVVKRSTQYGRVLVVDDGSSDATASAAASAGAEVVRHAVNRGYDAALNSGFERAAALNVDAAITLDADGQHDPETLRDFIGALDRGADLVIGVRDRQQRISERLYALWARMLWGIRDPLCGMKAYRLAVYRDHGCFDSCHSIGTELAICGVARGFRSIQLPVPTRPRTGTSRFASTLRANYRILRALVRVTAIALRLTPRRD